MGVPLEVTIRWFVQPVYLANPGVTVALICNHLRIRVIPLGGNDESGNEIEADVKLCL